MDRRIPVDLPDRLLAEAAQLVAALLTDSTAIRSSGAVRAVLSAANAVLTSQAVGVDGRSGSYVVQDSLLEATESQCSAQVALVRPLLLMPAAHGRAAALVVQLWRTVHTAATALIASAALARANRVGIAQAISEADIGLLLMGCTTSSVAHGELPAHFRSLFHRVVAAAEAARPARAAATAAQWKWFNVENAVAVAEAAAQCVEADGNDSVGIGTANDGTIQLGRRDSGLFATRLNGRQSDMLAPPPPTIEGFEAAAAEGKPFLTAGIASEWHAIRRWRNPQYWSKLAGYRTIPVEVGAAHRSNGANDWERRPSAVQRGDRIEGEGGGGGAGGASGHAQQVLMTLERHMTDHVFLRGSGGGGGGGLGAAAGNSSKRRRTGASADCVRRGGAEGGERYVSVTPVVPVTAASTKGYLAQTRIFDQIPTLLGDFSVPIYCKGGARRSKASTSSGRTSTTGGGTSAHGLRNNSKNAGNSGDEAAEHLMVPSHEPIVNIWFGGADVSTPLHFDRHSNLLVQVVGTKLLYLVDPAYTTCLYPQTEVENASDVDVGDPDLTKHPRFRDAVVEWCVLRPGDALFIPNGHWHSTRSLSPSISLSFWFTRG
jgi:hypothetical protein